MFAIFKLNAHSIELTTVLEWFNKSTIRIFNQNAQNSSQLAVAVCNHHYQIDSFFLWAAADFHQSLGSTKSLTKYENRYVPLVGWVFWLSEFIFLRRNWAKDKQVLESNLKALTEHPFPVQLSVFAEGTRFTQEKRQASLEYCTKNGLQNELKHHLYPRTKGLAFILKYLRQNSKYTWNHNSGLTPTAVTCRLPRLRCLQFPIDDKRSTTGRSHHDQLFAWPTV